MKKKFVLEEARLIGNQIGVNWIKYKPEQFKKGLEVEIEHELINPSINVTTKDFMMIGYITLAHLNEFPDYYDRLEKVEKEVGSFWNKI
jgi:hypothetical protein